MCEPASFVLTRDQVFWSMCGDSHEDIIAEHKLHQDGVRGVNVLRVEITPPEENFIAPAADWEFRLDQDLMPEWFDRQKDEARARLALADWIGARVIQETKETKELRDGSFWVYNSSVTAYGNSSVTACGNSSVTACGNSSVTAYGNSSVRACGNSSVTACGNSSVRACGNSSVTACDNSSVTACGNSSVTACDNSSVTACDNSSVTACDNSSVTACGNSSVRACDNSSVTACGNSSVTACDNSSVTACGNSSVRACGNSSVTACGNSSVTACEGYATVRQFGDGTMALPSGPHAIIIDSRGTKSAIITAAV